MIHTPMIHPSTKSFLYTPLPYPVNLDFIGVLPPDVLLRESVVEASIELVENHSPRPIQTCQMSSVKKQDQRSIAGPKLKQI